MCVEFISLIDDKENTIPDGVVPKLSDPSEFDTDYDKPMDEVDGYIDEDLDLPTINNEVHVHAFVTVNWFYLREFDFC